MDNKESFSFTYSGKEQEEILKIRDKYISKEADKMEQLRKLDASVYQKSSVAALVLGIIGALIMGVGMCCCLVWEIYLVGVPVGILGIVLVALAYPAYNYVMKKEREKIASEIIRITDELLK